MKHVNIPAMQQATGELIEIYLENGLTGARIHCPTGIIPAPGQYLLVHNLNSSMGTLSDSSLPAPVFLAQSLPNGFLSVPPIPSNWFPGSKLFMRGPLGHGFSLPAKSKRVVLAALGETAARLRPLVDLALEQGCEVVLVSDQVLSNVHSDVEIQNLSSLPEIISWADYLAVDLPRESIPELRKITGFSSQAELQIVAQALITTSMPCGGVADCALCAVSVRRGWKLACKDGPVFALQELLK